MNPKCECCEIDCYACGKYWDDEEDDCKILRPDIDKVKKYARDNGISVLDTLVLIGLWWV